jgi:hypothetical protein
MSTLLLVWCGGVLGQLALLLTNRDATRGMRFAFRDGMRRHPNHKAFIVIFGAIGALIPLLTWPAAPLIFPFITTAIFRRGEKKGLRAQEITCVCCNRKIEVLTFAEKWVSLDDWYINQHHEVACSVRCASHMENAHAERPDLH